VDVAWSTTSSRTSDNPHYSLTLPRNGEDSFRRNPFHIHPLLTDIASEVRFEKAVSG
jgi:hypothetical protein